MGPADRAPLESGVPKVYIGGEGHWRGARPPPLKPGMQRADFPLPEGIARIEFPASMSSESYEEIAAWLQLLLRRAKRDVKPTEKKGALD